MAAVSHLCNPEKLGTWDNPDSLSGSLSRQRRLPFRESISTMNKGTKRTRLTLQEKLDVVHMVKKGYNTVSVIGKYKFGHRKVTKILFQASVIERKV